MTGCRAWRIALATSGVWALILLVRTGDLLTSKSENGSMHPEKVHQDDIVYSWDGPNALARSALVDRQEKLQNQCEGIKKKDDEVTIDRENFRNLLVIEQYKLLYCYVPKVACTNWKRVLMIATNQWPGNDPLKIPANQAHSQGNFRRLSNYSLNEIKEKLTTFDKLIVVRHPLERLLSAYRNKFEAKHESSNYFQTRFGKKIVKKYRPNATEESLKRGDDVTFSEFVEFVTEEKDLSNEHWRPIHELCHPCIVNYNLVSKYETLVEDATEILERMGSGFVTFPGKPPNKKPTSKLIEKYYSTLTLKQLKKLGDLYHLDIKLFEYSLEEIVGFSLA